MWPLLSTNLSNTPSVTPSNTPSATPSSRPIPTTIFTGYEPSMAIQGQPFYGGLQIRANGNPIIVNGLVVNIYVDGNYEGQAAQGIVTAQGQFLPTTNTIGMTYTLPGLSVGTHAVTLVFLGNAQYASSSETLTFIIEAAPTPTPTPNANRNPNGDPHAGSHSQISESRVAGVSTFGLVRLQRSARACRSVHIR